MFRKRDIEQVGVLVSGALCWGQTIGESTNTKSER